MERDSGSCFLSVGTVVRNTGSNHICYFTMTVVTSMSPNGLTLLITLLNSYIPYILPVSTELSAWPIDGSQWSTAASVQRASLSL